MILGTGCLGESALDGPAVREALERVGLTRALAVVAAGAAPQGLAMLPAAAVRAPWEELERALVVAAATRSPRLVLELPRLMGPERACRDLHALMRRHASVQIALATPAAGPLADPASLSLVLEDLAAQRLGYWHRPARARLLGHTDAAWLDAAGGALVGLSLDDVVDGKAGFPPGLGVLDFRALAEVGASSLEIALDVDPLPDVALLRITLHSLRTAGFR